ncbi:MAG: ABC transporter ATP-binding protein [Aquihabitans sp.]
MTGLVVSGLQKNYPGRPPVAALRGVDLRVDTGSFTAVLGPSGSGKTTLLRALAGMERPDAGSITLNERTLAGPGCMVAPERRAIGLVPQEGALFPHLDVADNVAFGLRGLPRAQRLERVGELLALVDLAGFERRRAHQLSGGQQQRVALARALAPRPEVVLLDEPFSALDTNLRAQVRSEVAATLAATGTTAVLVTHDQTEALTMADQVAVMRDGRIVQVGSPSEVYRYPVDQWVASFVGDAVMLPGRLASPGMLTCSLGTLPVAPRHIQGAAGSTVVACFRPEQIRRVPAGADHRGPHAVVTEVTFRGPDAVVAVVVDGSSFNARWPALDLPKPGERVHIEVVGEVNAYAAGPVALSGDV